MGTTGAGGSRKPTRGPRSRAARGPRHSDESPYPGGQIRHAFDFIGDTTFTDLTARSGIPTNGAIAKGIGDFDLDGDVDFIAVANKSMPPVVYLNDGA